MGAFMTTLTDQFQDKTQAYLRDSAAKLRREDLDGWLSLVARDLPQLMSAAREKGTTLLREGAVPINYVTHPLTRPDAAELKALPSYAKVIDVCREADVAMELEDCGFRILLDKPYSQSSDEVSARNREQRRQQRLLTP